ncbi:MAG: aldehyde dehydrogenase family protein [Acetomicrobium flavidum]|uniref:aldehyde dehydrogenase family protein n=1 Tax=Acetomicrobium flavidum TaxID=49896 RepID=UPI0016A1353E|nr:aldehyde dehydrogenase family protein [Acetomicrobium flavidum]
METEIEITLIIGGKDFAFVHQSADVDLLVAALMRRAFEYQGQKCSATSRFYISESFWPKVKDRLLNEISSIKIGDVEDFANFMGAVIAQAAFNMEEK